MLEANPSLVRVYKESTGELLNTQNMLVQDVPNLLISMKSTFLSIQAVDKKALVMRVHFGAQLQALKAKCKKQVRTFNEMWAFAIYCFIYSNKMMLNFGLIFSQTAFKELIELSFGLNVATAYRYLSVAQLVDDYPNLLHCTNNWSQLNSHATAIRNRVKMLGLTSTHTHTHTY